LEQKRITPVRDGSRIEARHQIELHSAALVGAMLDRTHEPVRRIELIASARTRLLRIHQESLPHEHCVPGIKMRHQLGMGQDAELAAVPEAMSSSAYSLRSCPPSGHEPAAIAQTENHFESPKKLLPSARGGQINERLAEQKKDQILRISSEVQVQPGGELASFDGAISAAAKESSAAT
jgi:hypothetical protein